MVPQLPIQGRRVMIQDGPQQTEEVVTLWRPVNRAELQLVIDSDWRAWPPRLPDQPIFYPVLNREYAQKIAREWNVKAYGAGFVTCFDIRKDFIDRYLVQQVGGCNILEYWIPAEELSGFNAAMIGKIRLLDSYPE
jgi:hypothetical protein